MLDAQGQHIRLNHARDYLRQHFAIDAGLDNMDFRPLGSDPKQVDDETRAHCRERMSACRERAHETLTGLIAGAKITVWRETDDGGMSIAAPTWASAGFDGQDGQRADKLYFSTLDWEALLPKLTSAESRRYFFEQRTNPPSPAPSVNRTAEQFVGATSSDLEQQSEAAGTSDLTDNQLRDFARYDLTHGGLLFGTGWVKLGDPVDSRRDGWRDVEVSRADLMRAFPAQDHEASAFFAPIPASLPEIGLVMPLDEALSWLAVGRPSADLQVWENRAGELSFRDHNGVELQRQSDGSHPQFLDAFLQASRAMHSALRDGSLLSYVAPHDGQPLQVPRFYWNGVNPESLHHTYRGMSSGDHGAGCPVLFSRLAFDQWRAAISATPIASIDRAPSVKGGRPPSDDEILAKADEMKARGLDGRTIAKSMRLEHGFEHVATTTVRALIKGRWKPAGRPKKAA